MADSARSKSGSADSSTDDGAKNESSGKSELIGKLATRKSTDTGDGAEVNPSHSRDRGRHDATGEAGSVRGEHDNTGLEGTERGSDHGRHEAANAEVPNGEVPGYSPAEESFARDHDPALGDSLAASRPEVAEDERREPPHRVEAPKYHGRLPWETEAEFGERSERSSGDHDVADTGGTEALHAALITGEAQAGHRYPHHRP